MSRNIDETKTQAWKAEDSPAWDTWDKQVWHKVIPNPDEKEGWGEAVPYKSEDIVSSEDFDSPVLSEKEAALLDIRLKIYECMKLLDDLLLQVMESSWPDKTKELDSRAKGELDNIEKLITKLSKEALQ